MAVNAPTPAQLRAVAEDLGLSLTDADIENISRQAKGILKREWERVKRGT
jgi:hypothetical protein